MRIESFQVTSYEVNFASHHTCDRHVGFLNGFPLSIARYRRVQQNVPLRFIKFLPQYLIMTE